MGELAAARPGWRCAATSSSSAGYRSVPVALAAGARSVDHLSTLHPDDVAPLAAAPCAAVLLPAAEFLGAEHRAPARALLDAGAIVVLATDGNPGTAPVFSMPVVIGLAARLYGMTALEALGAATLNAAWTLDLQHDRGVSRSASGPTCCCSTARSRRSAYRFARNPVAMAFIDGEPVYVRDEAPRAARFSR